MNVNLPEFGIPFSVIGIAWLLTAIVHVGFAVGVYVDSKRMQQFQRRGTFLVAGALWSLATLLGGVFAAGVYWLVHHSSLRPVPAESERGTPRV